MLASGGGRMPSQIATGCRLPTVKPLNQISDEELFRLAADDEAAFVTLYRRHARSILAFLVRRTRDPELSADACAETFAVLTRDVLARRDPPASVSGWLHGVARNKAIDAQRAGRAEESARRSLEMPLLELTDPGMAEVERMGDDVRVETALDALPSAQRVAVQARVLREEPYETIARSQHVSSATVRQRVTRGLAKLRTTIDRPE